MPNDFDRSQYKTPAEVARMWGVGAAAVRKAVREHRVKALRTPTGRILIHRDDYALKPVGLDADAEDHRALAGVA